MKKKIILSIFVTQMAENIKESRESTQKTEMPGVLAQFATFALFMNILETKQPDMPKSSMLLLYKILCRRWDSDRILPLKRKADDDDDDSEVSIWSFPDFMKIHYPGYTNQNDQEEIKYSDALYKYTGYLTVNFDFTDLQIVKRMESILDYFYKNNRQIDLAFIYLSIYRSQIECMPRITNLVSFSIIKMQISLVKDKLPQTERMIYNVLCNIYNTMTKDIIDSLKKPTRF